MVGAEVAVAIALFLAAMAITALVVIAHEVRREDRLLSLAEDAPTAMSRSTRRLNGFGRKDLELKVLSAGRRVAA